MAFIEVTNAVDATEDNVNQIDQYFRETYNFPTPRSWNCLICGKKIIRQNCYADSNLIFTEDDIMVGGHLKDRKGNLYLAPICKECNEKKENLGFVDVDEDYLLPFMK